MSILPVQFAGVAEVRHCWCGHIVHYSKEPTRDAVRQLLTRHDRAIVIPVLVARDEAFQDRIIGGAIRELNLGDRVAYVADAILPDANLNDWVDSVAQETLARYRRERAPQQKQSR